MYITKCICNNYPNSICQYFKQLSYFKGQNLLSGLKLGIDIVDEIRQQTHVLSEYALTLRTVTESERINLQTELNNLKNDLQERWSNVEKVCKINPKTYLSTKP